VYDWSKCAQIRKHVSIHHPMQPNTTTQPSKTTIRVKTNWLKTTYLSSLVCFLAACGGGGGGTAVNQAPTANAGNNQTVVKTDVVRLNGLASSDTEGATLSYAWTLTRPVGSLAALNSSTVAQPTFTADVIGTYGVALVVNDGVLPSSAANMTVTAVTNSPPIANAGGAQTSFTGALVTLSGAASSDANGHALTYAWTLPTKPALSTVTLNNANTVSPTFTPDVAGTYIAQLTVHDTHGGVSSPINATVTATVPLTITNNTFTAACSGANCAATSNTSYAGSGIGLWRYNNTTIAAANVNIDISGVSAGKKVTLAFTNGNSAGAVTIPQSGTQASTEPGPSDIKASNSAPNLAIFNAQTQLKHKAHDQAHGAMLSKNQFVTSLLKDSPKNPHFNAEVSKQTPPVKRLAPALNATKTWTDTIDDTIVQYPSTNKHVCSLPSGRNVVFWQSNTDVNLTAANLNAFTTSVCGATGGFARLNGLVGDFWGPHSYNNLLISDTPSLQDVNVVFVNSNSAQNWAGYFYGCNNFAVTPSGCLHSNSSLVFFINTTGLTSNTSFYVSTLVHEASHMMSYYQNDILRNKSTDTWFEETSAMMAEDIVSPYVNNGDNKIASIRIPYHLLTGGNLSLNNWPTLSGDHYDMGGALGGFLNRQYGTNIYQKSFTSCLSGVAKTNSYECLNSVLINNGSFGIKEEMNRFGATTYARLAPNAAPIGFGYPTKVSGAYTIAPVDLSAMTLSSPSALGSYTSMTQTYLNETIAAGKTRYIRNNVVVPAGTSLIVVIKD
jgi:hypothetical protein